MSSRQRWTVVVAAIAVRWIFCWLIFPRLLAPLTTIGSIHYLDSYREIAQSVLAGRGYRLGPSGPPAMHRPPGYVLLVMLCGPSDVEHCYLWVQLIHGLLGGVAVWATCMAAEAFGLRRRAALFAAWTVALWPFLIWDTKVTVPETLLAALVAAAAWMLARITAGASAWWAVACGAVVGYTAVTHALYQAWVVAIVMAIAFRRKIAAAVIVAGVAAAIVAPWMWRNERIAGRPVGVALGFGLHYLKGIYDFEALLSGRPYFRDNDIPATAWVSSLLQKDHFPGIETDEERSNPAINGDLDRIAKQHLASHPIYTLCKIAVMLPLAWVHEQTPGRSAANAVFVLPFVVLAIRGFRGTIAIPAFIVNAAAAAVFVQAIPMRYALPLVPLLAIMSGDGLDKLLRHE